MPDLPPPFRHEGIRDRTRSCSRKPGPCRFQAALLVGVLLSISSFQVNATTVTATVSARVIPSLSAVTVENLHFGDLSSGPSAGGIVVSADGTGRSAVGGVELRNSDTSRPAVIRVIGTPNANYSIELPRYVSLVNTKGGNMQVRDFGLAGNSGRLDNTGVQDLRVGGKLIVPAHQPVGDYSGALVLHLNYN